MRVLGLTGDIACGKSTVAKILAAQGATVLDADSLVHELYADSGFAARVAALFPTPVLTSTGRIDRALLGNVVFEEPSALAALEALVHPEVARLRAERSATLRSASVPPPAVVYEAVKLLESGQGAECDAIWCVFCSPEVQIRRMVEYRGMSEAAARARLAAQPSRESKSALAGGVPLLWIDNDGSLAALEERVLRAWKDFMAA